MSLPKWAWFIVGLVVVLIVLVLLKVNINVGYEGIRVTQGLVH